MSRKFEQREIDMLYEQIRPDEEVLWRGKPKLIPNLPFLTTLLMFLLTILLFTLLVYINKMELWYVFSLLILSLLIFGYIISYSLKFIYNIKNLFYVITTNRLIIFDSKIGKIKLFKRYNSIKILRYKKTVFNTASIIFDIDFTNDRIVEIGFINIDEANEVLNIINQQLHHAKI